MAQDQFFQLVSLLAVALFIGSGALPLPAGARRGMAVAAIVLVVVGIVAALAAFVVG